MFVREGLCAGVRANMLQFISNINILKRYASPYIGDI